MTARPRANEVAGLIEALGSRSSVKVDAARARLSVIGARAVEALIESLDGDDDQIRGHAMHLLALIRDPRGREPLTAMLLDRDAEIRGIAAKCLARFPTRDAVAALKRRALADPNPAVRTAAVSALAEMFDAGHEEALGPVVDVLFDREAEEPLRLSAFAVVPRLKGTERRSVLRRLQSDPCRSLAKRAAEEAAGGGSGAADHASIDDVLEQLASTDYAVWNDAVHRLASRGAAVVEPLVDAIEARAHDPEYCTRAGMVLKALGPRRGGRALGEVLDRVQSPVPLQVLVEVVGALGINSLIYRLKDVLERIATRAPGPTAAGYDLMQRVRAKAHLEIARVGSRVAVEDLRDALGNGRGRTELEIVAAAELIGKRDELPVLLRAYRGADGFTRERIARAVRAILRRERLRRNSAALRGLGDEQRRTLESILDAARNGHRSR